ncbi:site-specific integrase [Rossellomorea aquimaris]|uniref:site-specific integrase n=1 Tax=Rossellomorea aquimaris TaxID=189382 RepID=UPI0005CB12CD|nr:site-specific integrase [Rossellomorea aquimaris]
MSRKLEASLKKVDNVFQKMYRNKITLKSRDKGSWSETTLDTYRDEVYSILRKVYSEYGVSDVTKIKGYMIESIFYEKINSVHKQRYSAYSLKKSISALVALNHGIEQTNVFKRKFSLGDPSKFRDIVKEQNIKRISKTSQTLRATPEECKSVLSELKTIGHQTINREMTLTVAEVMYRTGGRINSVLRLKKKNISIDDNKLTFWKDKGGLSRTIEISDETKEYLKNITEGKKDEERLFVSKKRDGTFKSMRQTAKEIEKLIRNAAKHLDRSELVRVKNNEGNYKEILVNRKFTPHSFRKSFALTRAGEYYERFSTKQSIDNYVRAKIAENNKIKEKLDSLRFRINKNRNRKRDLNREEYAIFFTSIDLGHFRNDVILSYYTSFKEVQEYLKK